MNKYIIVMASILFSLSVNGSVLLNSGDSFSAAFSMENTPDSYKLTDNYWEAFVVLIDSANQPGSTGGDPGEVTFTLFENTDFSNEIYSETADSDYWLADYGIPFWGEQGFFNDFDGSFTVSYVGAGIAELFDVSIANFAGELAPSNVAAAYIVANGTDDTPTASVPEPSALLLMLIGIMPLLFRRKLLSKT